MRPEETVLFSDLDGTLFNARGEISPENLAAIRQYMAMGGRFAIATGRHPDNALYYWPKAETNAPSVVINGAAVYDFNTGEYSHTAHVGRPGLDRMIRTVMEALPHADIQCYTRAGIRYVTPEATVDRRFLELHHPYVFCLPEELAGEEVLKSLFYVPPEEEETLRELLARGEGADYRIVPGTTDVGGIATYYELLPAHTSKGTAITALRTHPALIGRTFFAVGDYWNDYELLEAADIAVAPANAIDEVKAICQYETASNNEHAIAHIINDLIPSL